MAITFPPLRVMQRPLVEACNSAASCVYRTPGFVLQMSMRASMLVYCMILIACAGCSSASCGRFKTPMAYAPSRQLLTVSSFPWLVSIQDHIRSHLAVGTIISEFWIITAPSALKIRKDLTAVVGITKLDLHVHSRSSYPIHKVIVHEQFDEILHSNDFMLLMTKEKIRFDYRVQPICFPSLDPKNSALSNCKVSGWMDVKGYSGSTSWCRLSVENMDPCPLKRTVSTECCTHHGHRDPGCVGSGGSPVSCQLKGKDRWLLAGVLNGAGTRPYVPVLYTRTSYYSEWISSRTMEAGQPFIPTIPIINTVSLPEDQLHLRSAVKESTPQSHLQNAESMQYDYYNDNDLPAASGQSSRPDVCVIVLLVFFCIKR
ncbi:inactive serine protease 54 isoform X2 [Dendropsophus ebraccatus]|uniref:inactive serine protease 54 isoform X2 n=1 Tax=Dendropsophus ebraccatus TaxID=150705 RepID=UPI003831C70F